MVSSKHGPAVSGIAMFSVIMKLSYYSSTRIHMPRSVALFALFMLPVMLTACGVLPKKLEDTKNWSASKYYAEAKSELNDGNYAAAINLFEQMEARYPYGRYAQQAQLEIAYAHYKDGEQAQTIAAADRFIKLHPNHINVDFAYYLKGLANFNDDIGLMGIVSERVLNQDMSERDPKASKESFDTLRDLVTRFPKSKYAPDAIQRMKHLVNVV